MNYSAHEPLDQRRTARIRRENRGLLSGLAGEHAWKIQRITSSESLDEHSW